MFLRQDITRRDVAQVFLEFHHSQRDGSCWLHGRAISVHAVRRGAAKEIDKTYNQAQRSQHMLHNDPSVFSSYVANCSTIDGDFAFTHRTRDDSISVYCQSLSQFCEPGLPINLPVAKRKELDADANVIDLKSRISVMTGPSLAQAKHELRIYRMRREREALKQFQHDWVKNQQRRHSHP